MTHSFFLSLPCMFGKLNIIHYHEVRLIGRQCPGPYFGLRFGDFCYFFKFIFAAKEDKGKEGKEKDK